MKVTLLAINAKYVHSSLPVWCIADGLKQHLRTPATVKVIEATINQPVDLILAKVADTQPNIIGISAYIWNADILREVLGGIKRTLPDTLVVLGGPEASHAPDFYLSQGADYVVCGAGERALPLLVDAIATGAKLCQVAGLCYFADGKVRKNPIAPAKHHFDNGEYSAALHGRIAYIESSRGCPFSCSFCLSGGSEVSFFPMDEVKKQIFTLANSGAKTIKFVDRTFNCHRERATEILSYVISMDTDCTFHFEVAPHLFDQPTLDLLAAAPIGRIQLEAGLQSFNPNTLAAVSRKTDFAATEKNIAAILAAGNIHLHLDLIAGLPYETLDSFVAGFNRAFAMRAHNLQLGLLKLLRGSPLHAQEGQFGMVFSPAPPYQVVSTPWMSEEDFATLHRVEHGLSRTWNKGRFITTIEYVLSVARLSPFELFYQIGEEIEGYKSPLPRYTAQLCDILSTLPMVDKNTLVDRMAWDYLAMTGGKGMPSCLKNTRKSKSHVQNVSAFLGRQSDYDSVAVLSTGEVIYAVGQKNPVSGLFEVAYLNYCSAK